MPWCIIPVNTFGISSIFLHFHFKILPNIHSINLAVMQMNRIFHQADNGQPGVLKQPFQLLYFLYRGLRRCKR